MPSNSYFDQFPESVYTRPSFLLGLFSLVLVRQSTTLFEVGEIVSDAHGMSGQYVGLDEFKNMLIKLQTGTVVDAIAITGATSGATAEIQSSIKHVPFTKTYAVGMTDLLVRFDIDESIKGVSSLFYPYLWKDSDRPDTIADAYYGNPSYHWVLLDSCGAKDIYHDFPYPAEKFNEFLIEKYGALVIAAQEITNWDAMTEVEKTVATYEYLNGTVASWSFSFSDKPDIVINCDVDTYNYYTYLSMVSVPFVDGFVVGETLVDQTPQDSANVVCLYLKNDVHGNMVLAVLSGTMELPQTLMSLDASRQMVISSTTPIRTYQNEVIDATSLSVSLPAATTSAKTLYDKEFEANEAKRKKTVLDNDYVTSVVRDFRVKMGDVKSQKIRLGDI